MYLWGEEVFQGTSFVGVMWPDGYDFINYMVKGGNLYAIWKIEEGSSSLVDCIRNCFDVLILGCVRRCRYTGTC